MAYHGRMDATVPTGAGPKAPRLAWWVATGLGSGRLRPAPGTWGSLAGLGAWLLLAWALAPLPRALGQGILALAPLALTPLGVWASARVAAEAGLHDPSFIVVDEWAGLWVALTPLALAGPGAAGAWGLRLLAPFLLFRLFDIWKPGPVDEAQRLPGGWGIVADDLVAGALAALLAWPLDRWLLAHPRPWGG